MSSNMTAQEFNVRDATYRFRNITADAAVEQASAIATDFIAAKGGSEKQGKHDALRAVARECRISASSLRKFIQPSRRPKSIGVDLWQRLRGGYIAFLRRQLHDIQSRIDAVEAMGTPGPDILDLLDEAQALVGRIRKALGE